MKLALLISLAGVALAQSGGTGVGDPYASRIYRAYGAPATGCNSSNDVGKVYYRIDAAMPNASYYGCSATGASTYAWELQQAFPNFVRLAASTAQYNGYAAKMTAPSVTTASYNAYAGLWLDYGGYPTTSLLGAALNQVTGVNEVMRISQNVVGNSHAQALTVYQATNGTAGIPLYVQQSAFTDSASAVLYGANIHVAGCEGLKCTGSNYTDHSPGNLIALELDTEIRNAATVGYGQYNVCVNCVATSNSVAYAADARKSVVIGPATHYPWAISFASLQGAAAIGMTLEPTVSSIENPGAAKSDSQIFQTCAFTDNAGTRQCTQMLTTQNAVSQVLTPASKMYVLDSGGTHLAAVVNQMLEAPGNTADGTLSNTDMGQIQTNSGATGTVNTTLPTPVAGMVGYFYVAASHTWNLIAPTGVTIRAGSLLSATGATISSVVAGNWLKLVGTSTTTYVVESSQGQWYLSSVPLNNNLLDRSWVGTLAGSTINTSTTSYGITGTASLSTEATRQIVVPQACTITGVYLQLSTAMGGTTGNMTVTLRVNGAGSTLTFAVPFGSTAGVYSDTTTAHWVGVSSGDRLSVEFANGTDATSGGLVGLSITYR